MRRPGTLSVQHDLPFGMFATAGYLGTKGTRLDQQFIPNSVAPGAAESVLPHNFIYETSDGNSIYHAAQFQLNRRFRSGIMANAGYQFSKSIDDAGTGGRGQGNTPVAQNWLDLAAERGLSSFDARHNLTLQFQYSTGMGRSGGTLVNGWKGALIKDWTFSGNMSVRSGTPFTATVGGNRSQVSGTAVSNTLRANATGLPVEAAGLLFNTAAFSAPAGRRVGQCRTKYDSGADHIFVEWLAGTHLPVRRAAQRRPAVPGAESVEPRDDHELGNSAGVHQLRSGDVGRRHAQDQHQFEVQVLTYAINHCHRTDCAVCRLWAAGEHRARAEGHHKFEVNSQLVVVNVSAKDKNGAPLDGLKSSDFTVTEDGKAQQIKVFEFQRLEETPLPMPEAAAAVSADAKPGAATLQPRPRPSRHPRPARSNTRIAACW